MSDTVKRAHQKLQAWKPPQGEWGRRARSVILLSLAASGTAGLCPNGAAAAIDDAYPFGQRAMTPYKAWLAERKLARRLLGVEAWDSSGKVISGNLDFLLGPETPHD